MLALDHFLEELGRQWLDVDAVSHTLVGHDRGRVGVDQHRLVAFFAQGAAGLGAGVVELGRLANHDRAGADDHDLHRAASSKKSSKRRWLSGGPGQPSGWHWTLKTGSSRWRKPSTEPSFRFTCE